MARKPNYRFERQERERAKAAKKAAKKETKAENKAEAVVADEATDPPSVADETAKTT